MKNCITKVLASIAIISSVSCTSNSRESFLENQFEKYVETDFDDPSKFIEVSDIVKRDSILPGTIKETCSNLEDLVLFTTPSDTTEYYRVANMVREETDTLFLYEIKAREKTSDGKRIVSYYALTNGREAKITSEYPTPDKSVGAYKEFYKFLFKFLGKNL